MIFLKKETEACFMRPLQEKIHDGILMTSFLAVAQTTASKSKLVFPQQSINH